MSPNVVLVIAVAVLVTAGVYLMLERSLSRVVIGVILVGNGINLLILVAGGAAGRPPIVGVSDETMSDPLPQALVLTAIVITLGLTAFLLAMAYRSWQLNGNDEVQDDVEDRRIARLAARDERATADADIDDAGSTLDEDAEQAHDETDEQSRARPRPGAGRTPGAAGPAGDPAPGGGPR